MTDLNPAPGFWTLGVLSLLRLASALIPRSTTILSPELLVKLTALLDGSCGLLTLETAGLGPVMYANWQCTTSVYNVTGRRPSDPKPAEKRFRDGGQGADVETFATTQLHEAFVLVLLKLSQACAKEWLEERCVETKLPPQVRTCQGYAYPTVSIRQCSSPQYPGPGWGPWWGPCGALGPQTLLWRVDFESPLPPMQGPNPWSVPGGPGRLFVDPKHRHKSAIMFWFWSPPRPIPFICFL